MGKFIFSLSFLIFNFEQQYKVRGQKRDEKENNLFGWLHTWKMLLFARVRSQRQRNIASVIRIQVTNTLTGLPSQSFCNLMRSQWPWFDGCAKRGFIYLESVFRHTHMCMDKIVLHVRQWIFEYLISSFNPCFVRSVCMRHNLLCKHKMRFKIDAASRVGLVFPQLPLPNMDAE